MAVLVVDALEAVEVEHRDAQGLSPALCALELAGEGLLKLGVVEQAGERIVAGQALEPLHHPGVGECDRRLGGIDLEQCDLLVEEAVGAAGQGDERAEPATAKDERGRREGTERRLGVRRQAGERGHAREVGKRARSIEAIEALARPALEHLQGVGRDRGGSVRVHVVSGRDEDRDLAPDQGGLSVLGELAQDVLGAQLRDQVAQRREQALRDLLVVADLNLE